MNVLLANPPWKLDQASVYSRTGAVYPPLGLASLASVVNERSSHNATVLDAWGMGMGLEAFRDELLRRKPDVLGLSAYTTTLSQVLAAAHAAKQALPDLVVVLGGPHATLLPNETIAHDYIDFVSRGEGEILLVSLLEHLASGNGSPDHIPGLTHKVGQRVVHNAGHGLVEDLDSLPHPQREGLPMSLYRPASGAYKRLPVTSMITSRGCPFNCTFCSKAVFGNRVRARSANKMVEEVEYLIQQYGIREIYFADDCFTLDRERTEAFCERVLSRSLDLTWTCSTRANLVDLPLLQMMKRAGCVSIGYGVESGHDEGMRAIKKGITIHQTRRALAWTKSAGIETRTSYIFGIPGEDLQSLQRTLDLALELNSDFVIFNLAIPFPGTELYRQARESNLLLADGDQMYPLTDGAHVLIRLEDVTEAELTAFYSKAYRAYYLRPRYLMKRLSGIRSLHDLALNLRGLGAYLRWQRETHV